MSMFLEKVRNTLIMKPCRCGGAQIEVPLKHLGPVNCGEAQCSVLPPLPTEEEARTMGRTLSPNMTTGDLRAALDRGLLRPR